MDRHYLGSINLKPNKPDAIDRKKDLPCKKNGLFKIQQYISLYPRSNLTSNITDANLILFFTYLMTQSVAFWMYPVVQSFQTSTTWE